MGRPSDARQRLIEAAKEVIYANSYEAVTVDELCAAAGVNKSSFYHFFSSKQDLVLEEMESQWQRLKERVLIPAFSEQLTLPEQIERFFELLLEGQQAHKQASGHVRGCPLGNLTAEMSTQDELIRLRIQELFQRWLILFERVLQRAKEQGFVPATLETAVAAQALLAYVEGALLLAKGKNDPALLRTLRQGAYSLLQLQKVSAASTS